MISGGQLGEEQMLKFSRIIATAALIGAAIAVTAVPAAAQRHGGGHHVGGGGFHRGGGGFQRGGGFRGGFGPGIGFGFGYGIGSPYYYDDYYAAEPDCGWTRVRVLRNHHWVIRRAWRCW
jgi:hypothetical protein